MRNKKAKFLSLLCAVALVGSSVPVSAKDTTVKERDIQDVIVTASVSPNYVVTIPKTLTLDEEGFTNYTVTASGEIEKLSTLTVTPDESFVLTTKYDSTIATVSQGKTSWSHTDLLENPTIDASGEVVTTKDLTPGYWTGTFNFNIALNDHVHTDEDVDYYCDACSERIAPGLYDENDVLKLSWDELLAGETIHVTDGVLTTNYKYSPISSYPSTNTSSDILIGKLVIDSSVTSLGSSAFNLCSGLFEVIIPSSVTSIGRSAFDNCSGLDSITVGSENTIYNNRDNCNAIIETATNKLIAGCKNTIIPDTVVSIGDRAFYGCTDLTDIDIPSSVTSIGSYSFYNCASLTSIDIPSSVTKIGTEAFSDCSSLTSVTLSDGLTSIDFGAFSDCSSLTSITIPSSVIYISGAVFQNCSSLTSVTLLDGLTSIGDAAFSACSSLTSITIPSSVTSIGNNTFRSCSSLDSITVGSENTIYDSRNDCNAVIEKATNKLIAGCKNTVIPDDVVSIGEYAFYGCTGLTNITIPDIVKSIGDWAFEGCSGLTSVVIPSSITKIGARAFYNCGTFTINYKDSQAQWGKITKASDWNTNSTITMNYNY